MDKLKKLKKNYFFKNRIINTAMIKGKKQTGEILVKKCFKKMYKSCQKDCLKLLQLAIIESTPILKMNKQVKKKRKT